MNPLALARRRAEARGRAGAPSLSGASVVAGAAPGAGDTTGNGAKPNEGDHVSKQHPFNPWKVLKEEQTNKVLGPKELREAARALTALEIRPQVHGYSLLAKQLHKERETEATSLGNLGTQLTGEVGGAYKAIAEQEAQNIARQQALAGQLNTASANITQQGAQNLAAFQTGQEGEVTKGLEARGAPGGGQAQQELAQVVAQQQAAQGANAGAAQQFAASQGAGYGQLQAAMAGATQMQGGQAARGIAGSIIGRVGESGKKYDEAIQTARQKLADAKALKGSTFVKNLLELRANEQKYQLGKAAVQGEKADRHAEKEAAEAEAKENARDRHEKQGERAEKRQEWEKEYGLENWEAKHPNAGSGEKKEKRQEVHQEVKETKSVLGSLIGAYGAPKTEKQLRQLEISVNSKSESDPSLVRKVLQHWWEERHQGNRGNPKATHTPYAP